ncbi:MAG: phosphoesterase PA-phosphatase related protein [Gemmatimonadetes bacterium]|nr:phosphoesterase PA-phosphatase related protein [Gemmatimonadota bacterium]
MQLIVGILPMLSLAAQAPVATDTTRKNQTLFTMKDLALAGGFVGLTFAMFPADKSIARRLQNENSKANKFFDHTATGVELIASPGAYIIGPALYAYGKLAHHPDVADLGWHGTEAAILATGITGILKGALGRARPYVSNDTNPRDFKFGGGFSGTDRASFPSGHTTVAFAVASSVTSEARRIWPGHTNIVAPVLYGGAALVGLSRMYHNRHWASDVALGAGIGTFSGLKVVRYSHAHPDNFVDRILLSTSVMPNAQGGGVMAWSFQVR